MDCESASAVSEQQVPRAAASSEQEFRLRALHTAPALTHTIVAWPH